MTVLGYDLGLLDVLRRHVERCAGELGALRCTDPVAVTAMATVELVRRRLAGEWLADVVHVISRDPLGGRAVAGGRYHPGLPDWATPEVPDLDARMATFVELTAERLRVQGELVWDHANPQLHRQLAVIDSLIRSHVAAYVCAARSAGVGVLQLVRRLRWTDPMAAALVLRHLGPDEIDDRAFATAAVRILQIWHDGGERGERFGDWYTGGDNTADVLFRALADRPGAATEFLRRTDPGELFLSAQHDDLVARLLLIGTSPERVDEATAGEILRPILEWLPEHPIPGSLDGVTRTAPALVATAVSPWLPALGPRAGRWGWSWEEGDAALRWLLTDDAALHAMVAASDGWRERVGTVAFLGEDGRLDDTVVRELAATLAQVQLALHDHEIADAEADALMAELALGAAGAAISVAAPGAWGLAAKAGKPLLTPLALRALDRWGLIVSPERARADARSQFGDRSVDAAVIALTGLVAVAIERGNLPPDSLDRLGEALGGVAPERGELGEHDGGCRPRAVGDRLHAFVGEVGPRTDAATHHALLAVLYAFGNPTSDALLCS